MKTGDYINRLENLCERTFIGNYIQLYAGANYECLFCCSTKGEKHDTDCPALKYEKLVKEFKD